MRLNIGLSRDFAAIVAAACTAFVVVLAAPAAAFAAVTYGTFAGTHVQFVNVTEDATTPGDTTPLFGNPLVSGNSLDFNPVGFASSTTGTASDQTNGNLVFMITANLGSRIQSVTLSETGDTTLSGNVAAGSMSTASAIFASGTLDIHEVDFVGINHISVPFSFTFNPSGGTYFLGTDGGGGPAFNTQWTGSVTLPVEQILIANGFMFPPGVGATRISIDLDNTLTTVSQTATAAHIAKTDFGVTVDRIDAPRDIPEPGSAALLALSALALASRRRIRS